MNIVQITAGSGETFYCENCLRDRELIRALRAIGHECLMVPLYLPLSMEADAGGAGPIFYGGVNVYLQQNSALFRRTPRWIDRLFDRPALLKWAAKRAGMTNAPLLGQTTLSMLDGRDGRQRKELDRLVGWLRANARPDVVVLSNALLLGLARPIKQALGAEIACLLQDEDEFLDALEEPYRRQAWAKMAQRGADVDVFVSPSRYFAELMCGRMGLARSRVRVVPPGLPVGEYSPTERSADPPVVGFLSRMCHAKGLDLLAEAFVRLKADERFANLRLRAAGGKTAADDEHLRAVRRTLQEGGVAAHAELLPNLPGEQRKEFLRSLSVLAVPDRRGEAAGMFLLESLACGVPVVLPRTGAAPELLEATGGGLLYEPNDSPSLARALAEVLGRPDRGRQLGLAGRQAVAERFEIRRIASQFAAVLAGEAAPAEAK